MKSSVIDHFITLSNGVSIQQVGFGTFKITEYGQAKSAIEAALQAGYRAFDTAELYKNEKVLGEVFAHCGMKREELFITTKIANDSQGYDSTLKSFERALSDLQTDYVDLYLVHWPLHKPFFDTWRAIEHIYESKLARAIGVCNFHQSHFELLSTKANIKPMINQIEIHPYLPQLALTQYLKEQNIAIEAWSPLARGKVNDEPLLIALAKKYGKSASQVTLRWHIQHNHIVIPKSVTPSRINENCDIFDFNLTSDEMNSIDGLANGFRTGPNPDAVYEKNGF